MCGRKNRREAGFTLVEMIVVVAILGILAAIVIPALLTAVDRSRQRRTMADMNQIAKLNGLHQVDTTMYANALADLAPTYIDSVPQNDAWDNAYDYQPAGDQRSYTLQSFGRDGAAGPPAPATWINDPFDPDIIMDTGQFTQYPRGAQ